MPERSAEQISETFRSALDVGTNLVDTAEMYQAGRSEQMVGKVSQRDPRPVTVISKFAPYPTRLSARTIVSALKASLKRIGRPALHFVHFPFTFLSIASMMDAMAELHGLHARPKFDSGDIRADMVAVLAYQPPENPERRKEIAPHFMAYAARNTSFGAAWRDMVMEPPRRELRHLMTLGIRKKELTENLNLDLSLALLLGPILYWYVFLKRASHDPRELAEGVVDAFWKAFSVKKRG